MLRAVRKEWRLGRAGQRIRDAFDRAVTVACLTGPVESHGPWLDSPVCRTMVRVPASADAPRRTPAEIPPEEVQLALRHMLEDAGPSNVSDLRRAWERLYGWKRASPEIEDVFAKAIEAMRASGEIDGSDDRLRLKS